MKHYFKNLFAVIQTEQPLKEYFYKILNMHLSSDNEVYSNENDYQFFGYASKYNWFYNLLGFFSYTPLNVLRVCALLPLVALNALLKNTAVHVFDVQPDKSWPRIAFESLCAFVFALSFLPIAILKIASPKNVYTFIDSLYNAARLTLYNAFLIVKTIAYFSLDTLYDYHKNIKKSGFRKGIALFFGLLRFSIYFIDLALRSILSPFGKIEKLSFLHTECKDLQHNPHEEWRQASEEIFGQDEKAQKFNHFMGWVGKISSCALSITGWAAVAYVACPLAIQLICSWSGIVLSHTAAAVTEGGIILVGIGIFETAMTSEEKSESIPSSLNQSSQPIILSTELAHQSKQTHINHNESNQTYSCVQRTSIFSTTSITLDTNKKESNILPNSYKTNPEIFWLSR